MPENRKSLKKLKGRVYTPDFIVKNILDMAHYDTDKILKKHVIDNSCGDGAFLCEIIKRYCEAAIKNRTPLAELEAQLKKFIHGIEIEPVEYRKCIENVNKVVRRYGIVNDIKWDIICKDALCVDKYDGKMDYVLGNPPYVRVHNLEGSFDTAKKYSFAQSGMTDLYIVFYEIGIKMLNKNGILGYITPSSFFNSLAGKCMRKYFVEENLIEKLVDLKHFQAFDSTTYTAITILNKNRYVNEVEYYQFDEKSLTPYYAETLTSDDYYIANNFYFSTKKNLSLLKKVFSNSRRCGIEVKNGYATLCDDVFVGSFDFDSENIIPVIKSSRGEVKKIIYPYDKFGKLISETELKEDEKLHKYLLNKKEKLLKRSAENKSDVYWYAFGRSQAINDTYKNKISINALLRTSADLKITSAPAGTGVYGGLYLIGSEKELAQIPALLKSEEFSNYISLLGKYKSGGY